ncbi:uncharacterized protein LOC117190756 [Drosophila miranda]|uniref:uncharacterized protein LOC117190756 n=1 Tax=Drosophila miranda TaxID=7229 RepID=UPI00143FACFC|nr:uncharacterized protein LOC117190756 [Drosophila miranda]
MGTKAATTNGALSRLMLNTRGPKQWRRQLLTSVTRSVMLYAAPIWAKALRTASYARGLAATHRLSSIRITSAFRTVSDEAAHVIAGIAPLEFLAEERSTYYQETHGRGMDAAAKRQVRMAWTHQLIPSIDAWVSRKHGQVNFYLTQLLSGHGCFRSYLHRFGHADLVLLVRALRGGGCRACDIFVWQVRSAAPAARRSAGWSRSQAELGAVHAPVPGKLGGDELLRGDHYEGTARC